MHRWWFGTSMASNKAQLHQQVFCLNWPNYRLSHFKWCFRVILLTLITKISTDWSIRQRFRLCLFSHLLVLKNSVGPQTTFYILFLWTSRHISVPWTTRLSSDCWAYWGLLNPYNKLCQSRKLLVLCYSKKLPENVVVTRFDQGMTLQKGKYSLHIILTSVTIRLKKKSTRVPFKNNGKSLHEHLSALSTVSFVTIVSYWRENTYKSPQTLLGLFG